MSASELVAALDSPGGWQRDMVQFLLVERGDKSVCPALRQMASENSAGRNAAASSLHARRLGGLTPTLSKPLFAMSIPGVRRNAVRLCESSLKSAPELGPSIAKLIDDRIRRCACKSPARSANGTIRARATRSAGSRWRINTSLIFSPPR